VCNVCGQTFATTKGSIFYRLHHAPELVIQVLVLWRMDVQPKRSSKPLDWMNGRFETGWLAQASIVNRCMNIW